LLGPEDKRLHLRRCCSPRYRPRFVGHRVEEVLVTALVDQRAEPTVLFFEQFAGLVEFDLYIERRKKNVKVISDESSGRGEGEWALTMRPASKTI
jgi:hypothetical protein